MMKNYSMHTIPAAAVVAAALIFGVQAHAQTSTGMDTASPKGDAMAPASGKKKPAPELASDNSNPPAGTGATPKSPEARAAAAAKKNPGRVPKKPAPELANDNSNPPAGTGAMPKDPEARAAAMAQKNPGRVPRKPAPALASDSSYPPAGTGATPKR